MHPFLSFFSPFTRLNFAAQAQPNAVAPTPCRTYYNPLNLDYGHTPIPDFATAGRHRATADPVITRHKGEYYRFFTNQRGYIGEAKVVFGLNDKQLGWQRFGECLTIEAINENGVSARTSVMLAK